MTQAISSPRILWLQVWGLAAVQGAIALTWVIYNLYLVELLTQFGFPKTLATGLLILENLLAMVMEPLMGSFSDRAQQWLGSRFPFVAVGTILASACFILIPTVLIFGSASEAGRWGLPGMMVAWALAMTVFRSPALSLLGRYAFATDLPQAASILTLVGGVAGAMGPLGSTVILGLGPMVAFTLGSLTLLGAAAALRAVDPNRSLTVDQATSPEENSEPKAGQQRLSIPALALVFGTGVGVGFGFRLLMHSFPKILEIQVAGANKSLILGMIFVALALTAIPAGMLAASLGNRRAMGIGLVGMAGFCGLMLLSQDGVMAIGVAIALGAAFSLVSNGTIPFALSMVPSDKAGLGTGMFFSGGAAAASAFGTISSSADALSPTLGATIGAIAFLAAGICVGLSPKFQ